MHIFNTCEAAEWVHGDVLSVNQLFGAEEVSRRSHDKSHACYSVMFGKGIVFLLMEEGDFEV
jgi:hypothetical protein